MKKFYTYLLAALLCCSVFSLDGYAQGKKAPKPVGTGAEIPMRYLVEDGDTTYIDNIKASTIISFRNRKDWRRYYRLVYNFSKTYPYALVARKLVAEADSTIAARHLTRGKREKYINALQKELFASFEEPLKGMTVTQGQLLMKLIDREIGKSSYNIIKEYKSGITAGFWQGIAKIFGSNLKKHYDPEGEDKEVELLVKMWEKGDFPDLYFSIFGEFPKRTSIPSKYM